MPQNIRTFIREQKNCKNGKEIQKILGNLPINTPVYQYQSLPHMEATIHSLDGRKVEFCAFNNVRERVIDCGLVQMKAGRKKTYPDINLTIVKIPTRMHGVTGGWLLTAIAQRLTLMGVDIEKELLPLGAATFEHKEADESFFPPQQRGGGMGDWPTITVEAGWSESHKKLQEDAEQWLTNSNGDVKAVITVKVSRTRITIAQHKLGSAPQRVVVQKPPRNCPQ